MPDGVTPDQARRWRWKYGWIALAICVLCAEGAVAGVSRDCMPGFDLGILAGQLLLSNMFGLPEIAGVIAGIPAFVLAAYPGVPNLRHRWFSFAFAALVAVAVAVVALSHANWLGVFVWAGLIVGGALIGFWIRAIDEFRRFWLPMGIVMALCLGSVIFSFGHYGQNNCWP
jgi:hypothetical protein